MYARWFRARAVAHIYVSSSFLDLTPSKIVVWDDVDIRSAILDLLSVTTLVSLNFGIWSPISFRRRMRVTASVLSGPGALAFLTEGATWSVDGIELFVPYEHAMRVVVYLREREGFRRTGTRFTEYSHGVCRIFNLQKDGKHIDVIQSAGGSLYPIAFFFATHVMNYISADHFCCAYPSLTLQGRSILSTIYPNHVNRKRSDPFVDLVPELLRYRDASIAAYAVQGFSFSHDPCHWEPGGACTGGYTCPHRIRSVEDGGCMTFPLEGRYADPAELTWGTSDSPLIWRLGGVACECTGTRSSPHLARSHAKPIDIFPYPFPVE